MSATVHKIRPAAGRTLGSAVDAFLANAVRSANTRAAYGGTLKAMIARFGEDLPLDDLDPDLVAEWVTERWGDSKPATFDRALTVLRSARKYWRKQGWLEHDPTVRLEWRQIPDSPPGALSRQRVEAIIEKAPSARDKLLWRMLYETSARIEEVLKLNVEDLNIPNRCAEVIGKGDRRRMIAWQTGTAKLLTEYLKVRRMGVPGEIWLEMQRDQGTTYGQVRRIARRLGISENYVSKIRKELLADPPRKGPDTGPLFLTARRARVELPPSDMDPESGRARLGYDQAWRIFSQVSGGAHPHQMRHSRLTHAAEEGESTPMLKKRSGHKKVTTLDIYTNGISDEAYRRHLDETDPASRRYR